MESNNNASADAPKELHGSVILDVEPISCSMRLGHTRDPKFIGRDSLAMEVRLPWRVSIETSDERDLKGAEWSLMLYCGGAVSKFAEQYDAVGQLDYLGPMAPSIDDDGFPESCAAYVMLDEGKFALLRDMARAGKLPSHFRLHIRGMEYGWQPDGSGKVWNIEVNPRVVITEFEAVMPLITAPDAADDAPVRDWVDPKLDSPELVAARATTKAIEQVNTRLGWVVFLLATAAAALIFR
jgi:hypothetical protein